MDDTTPKPPRASGALAKTRRENERLLETVQQYSDSIRELRSENARLQARLEEAWLEKERLLDAEGSKPELEPGPAAFAYATPETLAVEIFIRRAAALKLESFPDEAFSDVKAQRPVWLFWEKLRNHALLAATVFYSEADARPGEEVAEAPEQASAPVQESETT